MIFGNEYGRDVMVGIYAWLFFIVLVNKSFLPRELSVAKEVMGSAQKPHMWLANGLEYVSNWWIWSSEYGHLVDGWHLWTTNQLTCKRGVRPHPWNIRHKVAAISHVTSHRHRNVKDKWRGSDISAQPSPVLCCHTYKVRSIRLWTENKGPSSTESKPEKHMCAIMEPLL